MGKLFPYSIKWEKTIVMICHICGDVAIFLLFYDDQDTLSNDCEI